MFRVFNSDPYMKNKSASTALFNFRVLVGLITLISAVLLALIGFGAFSNAFGQPEKSGASVTGQPTAGNSLPPADQDSASAYAIEFTQKGMVRRRVPVTIKRQSASPRIEAPDGCPTTITHSLSQAIVAGNSTACFDDKTGFTRENTYWRAFDMNTFAGGQAYDISEISFGVEESSGNGLFQDLDVVLWTNNGAPFPAGTLEPLAIFFLTIIEGSSFMVTIDLDGTTVPAGTLELVMEVSSPDGAANGNVFLIGSNSEGQTGPSYFQAPDCGFPDPVDLASIGFPNMHMVFNVEGSCPGGTPTPRPRFSPTPRPRPTPRSSSLPQQTPTPHPSETPHVTPTPTLHPSQTPHVTPTPTSHPSETPHKSPTPHPSETPHITPTPTLHPSETPHKTPTPHPSVTPHPSETPHVTPTPTLHPSQTPHVTPTPTPHPSETPHKTPTPHPSGTPHITPTPTLHPS